jgi:hypothetical protein
LLRLTHLYIKGVFLLGFNTLLFFDGASLKSKVTRAIYPFLFDSKGTGKILKIAGFEHFCENVRYIWNRSELICPYGLSVPE